ncbi:DUF551 domain-containing protein [Escherichia coli]|nr:DUF551 domain-containing protein [Escherichia coli]
MTTMNREEQKQILIDTANHIIHRDNTSPYSENLRELARIALASLEAEPVAYIFKHPAGKLFWALTDESNKDQSDVIPVYAAAPASVVPDNASEPLAYAYKELTPEIMRGHIAVFERYGIAPNDSTTTIQALRIALDGIERSDAMLQSGNFRENKNSSTNNFREIAETSTNYPVIPSEVLSAILKVAKIRADFDDFDGDRRGIDDCLDEAEQELIVTINKYASQLAAEPIATNDVREQTAVPPVPVIQADVAQAIEKLKRKLVECNRYNYCADAVKGVEDACRAVSYSHADNQPASGNQAAESNRGNEWTGNPDIDNAIIMLDRIDTLESCDDDRIEAVKAVLRRLAGNSPVTPDGWISCSERMPDDAQWCVVDAADGYYVQCWSEGQGWLGDDISLRNCDVIRWMAIPEPPEQDGE